MPGESSERKPLLSTASSEGVSIQGGANVSTSSPYAIDKADDADISADSVEEADVRGSVCVCVCGYVCMVVFVCLWGACDGLT